MKKNGKMRALSRVLPFVSVQACSRESQEHDGLDLQEGKARERESTRLVRREKESAIELKREREKEWRVWFSVDYDFASHSAAATLLGRTQEKKHRHFFFAPLSFRDTLSKRLRHARRPREHWPRI